MIKKNIIQFENEEDNKYKEIYEIIIEDMNLEPYFKHLAKEYNEKTKKREEKLYLNYIKTERKNFGRKQYKWKNEGRTSTKQMEEQFWNETNLISFYVQNINSVLNEYKNKPFKKLLESIMNTYKVKKIQFNFLFIDKMIISKLERKVK